MRVCLAFAYAILIGTAGGKLFIQLANAHSDLYFMLSIISVPFTFYIGYKGFDFILHGKIERKDKENKE